MSTYKVGNGTQQINLSADISTIGLAGTRATVQKPGNPPVTVTTSKDVTGDISPTEIDSAKNLQNSKLLISTLVDLRIVGDETARKKEFERITATYTLDNGVDGHVIFDQPDFKTPSDDFTSAILIKTVDLL